MSDVRLFIWDYRRQPDMAAIAAAVAQVSAGGPVFMREVETGTDDYAWVVSDAVLTERQAWRLYVGEDAGGSDE